jgi:F-type H+-transporting ATPase subunit alpha
MLKSLLDETGALIDERIARDAVPFAPREVGTVVRVGGSIALVRGLPRVTSEELVEFPGGLLGLAVNLEAASVGVVLLGDSAHVAAGAEVRPTGRIADAPVGEELLGRVIDATGRALDGGRPLDAVPRRPVERPAPAIMDRAPVTRPLHTGLKVVDALVPIGRGQRELIVGDRQTGKTTIALDTILSQRDQHVACVYCAIGQRGTAVARVVDTLRNSGALAYTVVVVAAGEDAPGLQFLTPYAATTMAEHFSDAGRDALIVYDDLTRHARAYRELSLLLRRPPGREAYPGDIFYIHSRLLERSAQLGEGRGGGSLTALPIVETQAQDIAAYIPTNLISITDGQIYVSPELYRKGRLPAVDVGRSVSRVGGKTQLPAYRAVAGDLRLAYSQFEELETFSRFATRLDDETRRLIERGRRVRAVLAQPEHQSMPPAEQIAILHAVNRGLFDGVALEDVPASERAIRHVVREHLADLGRRVAAGDRLADADWQALADAARAACREEDE